jgi:osmotically-inducible protein OsmY
MLRLATLVVLLAGTPALAADTPFFGQSSDTLLSLHVTAAIQAEPALKDLPLVVDVTHGVAVVGGEVPRKTTLELVKAVVASVPGLKGQRVECRIPPAEQSFYDRVRARLDAPPKPRPAGKPAETQPPAPPTPQAPTPLADRHVVARKASKDPRPAHVVAAEALREGDARFADLRLAFDGGLVTVSGTVPSQADATVLMLHLRHVPGVERVRRGSIAAPE